MAIVVVFVVSVLVTMQVSPCRVEAAEPLKQTPAVTQKLPKPPQAVVPKKNLEETLPVYWIGDKKCVGDNAAGCCVTATQKSVWGGFNPDKCPVYGK